ncbi:hypothetical protein WME90_16530 [Sorangium sp. So ce375]|uniref:hypothetical protein n=1 Tax=Sorangium sp. So ce375 TaxID=3133306 RepID=UPI003F5C7366
MPWLLGAQAITVTANHADATGDVSIRKFIAVLVFELASSEDALGVNIAGDVHVMTLLGEKEIQPLGGVKSQLPGLPRGERTP